MKTFFTPARIWAPGTSYLHVYLTPDLSANPELAQLIGQAEGVLAEFPFVAPMNPKWRHCTVASTDTEGPHSEEAVTTLMNHIAAVPCFDILMGSPGAGNSAVLLDSFDADGGFAALEAAAVEGLKEACGDGKPGGGRAHMSIGYGIADGDSGVINSKLRTTCDPSHAVWHVDEALIVQVTQHPTEGEYRWEELGRVLLAA